MNNNAGKKYIVVPRESYQVMAENKNYHKIPERTEIKNAEQEMNNIWDTSIPPYEKMRRFTQELSKFKSMLNELSQPLKVQMETSTKDMAEKADIESEIKEKKPLLKENERIIQEYDIESVVDSLPKSVQNKGKLVIDYLNAHKDKINWNEKGEMIIHGRTMTGSSMKSLLGDMLSSRKKPHSQPLHSGSFLRTIAEIDLPTKLIKNYKYQSLVEEYKNEQKFSPSKRTKIDWLSSTPVRK